MDKVDIRIRLAKRIRALRAEHNITQEELSQRANLSLYYIQLLESLKPKRAASVLALEKIANAFSLEPYELLRFDT